MANLTAGRNLPQRATKAFRYGVKAATTLYRDAIMAVTATGLATKPGASGAVAVVGLVPTDANNSAGADRDILLEPRRGIFPLTVPTADHSHIGATVYAVDDNVLSLNATDGGSPAVAYLKVGVLVGIEAGQTYVEI